MTLPASNAARPRLGYVVQSLTTNSSLPTVDWFIDPVHYGELRAKPWLDDYKPAVVSVGGEVWDGVRVRVSGNGRSALKYSFKFKMPKGAPLQAPFLQWPVDEFKLDGDMNDPTGVIAPVASSIYEDSNPVMPQIAKVHVEQNFSDFGLFSLVEETDKLWRKRNGLDGPGDIHYEPEDITGVFIDDGSSDGLDERFKKENPEDGDHTHLYELIKAVDSAPTPERAAKLRDMFDLPSLIDGFAANAIVQHWDTTVHNYQLLRDGETGKWSFVYVDFDNTLYGTIPAVFPYGPDHLVSALRSDPVFSDMYLRRVRTLADKYLGGGVLLQRFRQMQAQMVADQSADLARWPRNFGTPAQGKAAVEAYIAHKASYLLSEHQNADGVPNAPTPGLPLVVSDASFDGVSGPSGDSVTIYNPSQSEAIDLSGWKIEGAGSSTLPEGSVIPPEAEMVVPADTAAASAEFAAGTLLMGHLDAGGLDDAGGALRLRDLSGRIRAQAVLSEVVPRVAQPRTGLEIEASADQVETTTVGGAGVKLTVAVTNHGPKSVQSVALSATGTTCARTIGPIAVGQSVTFRCETLAYNAPDRSYRIRAVTGSSTYRSNRVEVRRLVHATNYWSQTFPNAPTVGHITLGEAGTVRIASTLAPPTSTPTATTPGVRWLVVSGLEKGRAIPTQGSLVAPGPVVSVPFTENVPVRVAAASRNGAGTSARTPLSPWITPRPNAQWPFASTDELIDKVYLDLEGALPTVGQRQGALAQIDQLGPAALVAEKLGNQRWGAQIEPLIKLYEAYFDRAPDVAGLKFWADQRASGRTLMSISGQFARSGERLRKTGSLSNEAFVRYVYDGVFGRKPDSMGHVYWTYHLNRGMSRGAVMVQLSESSEGKRTLAPAVSPALVGYAMLGTPMSGTEAEAATEWLAAGGSLLSVIEGVRSSDAYANRVN